MLAASSTAPGSLLASRQRLVSALLCQVGLQRLRRRRLLLRGNNAGRSTLTAIADQSIS